MVATRQYGDYSVADEATVPLQIAPLQFTLEGLLPILPQALTLWHGGLGKMLHDHFPDVFDLLYEEESAKARLYSISPPLPDLPFLNITLFGPAAAHAVAITQALIRLGARGFSSGKQIFQLRRAALMTPSGSQVYYEADSGLMDWPSVFSVTEFLKPNSDASRVRIHLLTPLMLKEGNQFLREAPEFPQLIRRLLSRVSQVCFSAGVASPFSKAQVAEWLNLAESVQLVKAILHSDRVERQSGRSGNRMTFSGFTGKLEYVGDITSFVVLLKLGEKFQLGGKTAFGFGVYRFEYADQEGAWH